MRITDRVYIVGSGKFGMQLSSPMDCNVYLLDGGTECALVDAGSGMEPERIVGNAELAGIPMDKVRHLLLTHVHGDHAAGAHYFHSHHGLQVIVSAEAAPWLEAGDMDKTSLNAAKAAGVYPENFSFPACAVQRRVTEGDTIRVGDLVLKVLNTPGHSKGHVSYLFEENGRSSCFSGDVVFSGGKIVIQYIWDCIIQEYAESIAKLAELRIDRLFPGHGTFLLSGAYRHIELANASFKRLEIPPNL